MPPKELKRKWRNLRHYDVLTPNHPSRPEGNIGAWAGVRFPDAASQREERHVMRLGSVQCTLGDEEVIPLQFAFLRNVFAVVKTAGLLIATV
jgi:hypothetical protein